MEVFVSRASKLAAYAESLGIKLLVENNVLSTKAICKACEKNNVEKMILISTDKAVRPTNVMGASKRFAEMCLQAMFNQKNIQLSKLNRFEIDTKDQILSQKLARENNLEVLCCAHSHPIGENKPSEMDLFLHQSPCLMVISNKDGDLKAWWIKNKLNFHSVKIEIFSLT